MIKRFFSVLFAILVIASLTLTANAFEEPDLNRTGSVNITLNYQGTPVIGGNMTIYRVAEIHLENDADYTYRYADEYAECTASLENLNTADLAKDIAEYAVENSLSGNKKTIDNQGKVSFDELELGLYLFVQETAGEGYEVIAPFLVSVPVKDNNTFVYDVDASPKLELVKEPAQTTESTQPTESTQSTSPPEKLPQTGQLKWPVPVLVAGGLLLVILGWYLYFSERKKHNEI